MVLLLLLLLLVVIVGIYYACRYIIHNEIKYVCETQDDVRPKN